MHIATIIVCLLPIICGEYQEMQLICELTDYFNFDHHFYLLNSSTATSQYINTKGLTPQSLYVLSGADDVNGLDNVKDITSKNTLMIVVPDTSQVDHSSNLLRWMKTIQRLQINMKIGVFFPQHSSAEDLHTFFAWCKDNLIINIFAATHPSHEVGVTCPNCSINIFTFNPFGTFCVLNVTNSETYGGFFLSLNSNFHQHELQLGHAFYNRYDEKLWDAVSRHMNASFAVVTRNYSKASEAFKNGIDIIPETAGTASLKVLHVYPLELNNYIILVPEALPYSGFSAYVRNAISGTLCGYSFISILAVILVLSILRYTEKKKILFFQSAADVLRLLMNDNGYIKYPRLSRSEVLLIVPLTFLGLVVANGIVSNLKSYLTRPVLQPQINTLEDIYSSPFRILLWTDYWKGAIIDELSNRTDGKDWSNKVFVDKNFYEYIGSFNRSTSYFVNSGTGNIVLEFQKRSKVKGYHNPRIQMFSKLLSYPLNEKFLFFERLNEIILRLKSAGLYELWDQMASESYYGTLVKKYRDSLRSDEENSEKANVDKFEFPMFVFYGWSAGLIVLILEIVWQKNAKKILSFCNVVEKC